MKNIVIIGGGAWGLALASVISENAKNVIVYSRNSYDLQSHPDFPNVIFLPNIRTTQNIAVMDDADAMVIAIPAQKVRNFVANLKNEYKDKVQRIPVIIASKGIENNSCMLMSQIIEDVVGKCQTIASLSGPNFALEVMHKVPSASLLAISSNFTKENENNLVAESLVKLINTRTFVVHRSIDLLGTQICGAIKNVFAIGAGMLNGMGGGDNTKAAFLTSSLAEMTKIVTAYGGELKTVMSVAGIGDLSLTCSSMSSRNARFGYQFAKEASFSNSDEFISEASSETIEGLATVRSVQQLMKKAHIWSNKDLIESHIRIDSRLKQGKEVASTRNGSDMINGYTKSQQSESSRSIIEEGKNPKFDNSIDLKTEEHHLPICQSIYRILYERASLNSELIASIFMLERD